MPLEFLISSPHEFPLTKADKDGIEDLFYTTDQGFGGNVQARAAGALMQQLIANQTFTTDKTNSQLLKLSHFGETLHQYIEGIVHVQAHDKKLKDLADVSSSDREKYARIQQPKKKTLSAVDFPNSIFPANGKIENSEIAPMKNIMLELKCHFPSSQGKLEEVMSDSAAKRDFNDSLKSATNNMSKVLRPRFMALILVFNMSERMSLRSRGDQRPFQLLSATARWVMSRESQARAKTFVNHIEPHDVDRIEEVEGNPGVVKVTWKNGQESYQFENALQLSEQNLQFYKNKRKRQRKN